MLIRFAVLLIVPMSGVSVAAAGVSCLTATLKAFPDLQAVQGDGQVATGDFDGDGAKDTALFVTSKSKEKPVIAVCLSSRKNQPPLIIEKPYVTETLSVAPKGAQFYNYNTDREGTYSQDGISVSCCECCGATYIYSNGRFEEIVDSD